MYIGSRVQRPPTRRQPCSIVWCRACLSTSACLTRHAIRRQATDGHKSRLACAARPAPGARCRRLGHMQLGAVARRCSATFRAHGHGPPAHLALCEGVHAWPRAATRTPVARTNESCDVVACCLCASGRIAARANVTGALLLALDQRARARSGRVDPQQTRKHSHVR